MPELFRNIPSVDSCLVFLAAQDGMEDIPRALQKDAVACFLESQREAVRAGRITDPAELELAASGGALLEFVGRRTSPHLKRVLNATGVVVHTNMGRAVLAKEALDAVISVSSGYSNLELDLSTGKRGSRYSHVEALLCRLTGAEAALVVNNNAAAVFLVLNTLCRGREVVVARGQLVEIGGSFRIPDVMTRSGAALREVGCTNRVHPEDYERAVTPETAALMRVHTSNFRVVGFHADVEAKALANLAHERGLLFIEDLGSGSLLDLSCGGLPGEPTVRGVVEAGADVVTFSGDKVLGGPQAGIIVGRAAVLEKLKKDPLNRALRVDKMTLAALEATLRLYLSDEGASQKIPTLRMLFVRPETLHAQAKRLAARLKKSLAGAARIDVVPGVSRVGGGAFPENDLPGFLVRLHPVEISLDTLRERLLAGSPPLVGRLDDGAFCLDVRTLAENEWPLAVKALVNAFSL